MSRQIGEQMLELSETKRNVTWQEAIDYATSLGEGWRLPTKEELQIIQASPRAKEFATDGWFWSSSTIADNSSYAWYVLFYDGYAGYFDKTFTSYVRCVRGSFDDLILWCFGEMLDKKEEPVIEKNCDQPCVNRNLWAYCRVCIHGEAYKNAKDHFVPQLPAKTKDLTWQEAYAAWQDGWEIETPDHCLYIFTEKQVWNTHQILSHDYQLTGKRR